MIPSNDMILLFRVMHTKQLIPDIEPLVHATNE